MPKITEGLENGEEQLDIDSDAGFNARLAAKVAGDGEIPERAQAAIEALKETDRSVERGLSFGKESQPRDEQGRFAPVAQEAEEEGAAPAAEEREEEEETPDLLAEFLERHGGDRDAALLAALKENENAQSLVGRHATEVGETRQEMQALRDELNQLKGRVEAPQAIPQQQMPAISRDQLEEWIAGPEGDGSGFHDAWDYAAESGDPRLLEATLEIGEEYATAEALKTRFRFERELERIQAEEVAPTKTPERDPRLVQMDAQDQFNESLNAVQATKDEKDWALVAPRLTKAAETAPQFIQEALVAEDPKTQRGGMDALYELAKASLIADATAKATAEAQTSTDAQKRAASVATGSLRPAEERQPEGSTDFETRRQEALARFKESIIKAPSTSVLDSIEYGSSR